MYTNQSKFLSKILRHQPELIGLSLDTHGWANVDELIEKMNHHILINREILETIVKIDKKQRYSFNEDKTLIRANQGHSIDVDVNLTRVYPDFDLYHGTATRFVESIGKQGLLRMNRLYVHLSKDIDTAIKVASRHGKPFIYQIDVKKMMEEGYEFYLSKNGVYLTREIPVRFLKNLKELE